MGEDEKVDKKDIFPAVIMGGLFVLIHILALVITGTFEEAEWDKLSSGTHTIRFFANNSMGQIFFSEVIITKETESAAPEIPGINLFVILPIIMIAVIGLVLRYKKKYK